MKEKKTFSCSSWHRQRMIAAIVRRSNSWCSRHSVMVKCRFACREALTLTSRCSRRLQFQDFLSAVSMSNILGGCIIPDIIFGSLATLLGAIFTYMLRKQNKFLAPLPPIVSNILIVPFVLRYGYQVPLPIPFMMLTVGIGEVISCGVLGMIVYAALNRYKHTNFRTASLS